MKWIMLYIQHIILQHMNNNIKFKNQEEIQQYAINNNKLLVLFDNYVLDATTFAKHHPGGAGLILNYKSKDIKQQMKSHYPLSLVMANTMTIGSLQQEVKKVLDPTKPLMPQIWHMDHDSYLKIVDSPHWLFVQSPRMFESNFFQAFSHNKWNHIYYVPIFLVTLYFLFIYDNPAAYEGKLGPAILLIFLLGLLAFTLVEYVLHRFIFHSEKYLFDNAPLRYVHFILHGIHHMLPLDPDRLVYPPGLAAITTVILLFIFHPLLQAMSIALAIPFIVGFLLGYFAYDTTHYMLHHFKATKGSYFYKLQQYHNRHHFSGEQAGFGVSSKLWDIIFRTEFKKQQSDHIKTK